MESLATKKGYIIATLLGAASGGLFVLVITNAIPKMMKRVMLGMMGNMRAQMAASECKPEEM